MRCAYSYESVYSLPSLTTKSCLLRVWWSISRTILNAALVFPLLAAPAFAAELIVVDQANCPYCERFEREIAPAWPNTDEGRDVPLRWVDLHSEWPSDLDAIDRPTLTPTFILVENGEERGRLAGYAGDEHFWFLIGDLLESSPAQKKADESAIPDSSSPTDSTEP